MNTLSYVFKLELRLLLRHSQEWLYPLGFFVIVVCLFPLAFTPDPVFLKKYIPGCIWIAALLASLLSIENLFQTDMEDGYLEQQLLSPHSLTPFMYTKLAAHWLVTQLPLILLTPILGLMFHLPILSIATLMLALVLGTPILTLVGALGVVLTIGLRQPGIFLGLLILPLSTPVLIFGVSIVQQAQGGFNIAGPVAFLAALSVLAIVLLPATIAATIRVGVDD